MTRLLENKSAVKTQSPNCHNSHKERPVTSSFINRFAEQVCNYMCFGRKHARHLKIANYLLFEILSNSRLKSRKLLNVSTF